MCVPTEKSGRDPKCFRFSPPDVPYSAKYVTGDFWGHMVEAAQNSTVSYSVVINPNSGPGDLPEEAYTTGLTDLVNAGVEVGGCTARCLRESRQRRRGLSFVRVHQLWQLLPRRAAVRYDGIYLGGCRL